VGAAGLPLHRRQRMVDCDGDVRGMSMTRACGKVVGRCGGRGDCGGRRETGARGEWGLCEAQGGGQAGAA
jgi:hypothetical protein